MVKTLFPLLCIALATSVQNANKDSAPSLSSVVIVTDGLPQGCHLPPRVAVNEDAVTITGASIPENPWVGSDSTVISGILQIVDPPLSVPDGPPPDPRTLRLLSLQYARKISEGAMAIYDSGNGLISLYALKYRDSADMPPSSSVQTNKPDTFEVRYGAVRIMMLGNGTECSLAIAKHVKSMAPEGAAP